MSTEREQKPVGQTAEGLATIKGTGRIVKADTKTTVDIDVDLLHALLDRLSERRSESEIVEDVLRRYLAILNEFSSSEELLEALEDLQDLRDYDRAVAAADGACAWATTASSITSTTTPFSLSP